MGNPANGAMGGMDPMVQQQLETSVISAAKKIEDTVDEQLNKLDKLDENDLESLRRKRIDAMRQKAKKKKEWLSRGHGEYRELFDERDFFKEAKGEDKFVVHFYRDNWPCKVMDKHIDQLCKEHLETKFVKMNAEKCPFLTDRLNIWMLPTLAIVRSEKTTDYVVGFDELGGTDDFETETLRQRLAAAGAVDAESAQEDDDLAALTGLSSAASGKAKKGDASSIRRGHGYKEADDEDSDDLAD